MNNEAQSPTDTDTDTGTAAGTDQNDAVSRVDEQEVNDFMNALLEQFKEKFPDVMTVSIGAGWGMNEDQTHQGCIAIQSHSNQGGLIGVVKALEVSKAQTNLYMKDLETYAATAAYGMANLKDLVQHIQEASDAETETQPDGEAKPEAGKAEEGDVKEDEAKEASEV